MAIPALSRNYWTRANQPFAGNLTLLALAQSALFLLKTSLLNTALGGATSGARVAGSIWTVLGSSDGTTAGIDAVDRWAAHTNIVFANNGTAHSWWLGRCAALGYDILIDANSATPSSFRVAFTPSTTPFTGGSTLSGPTSLEEITAGALTVGAAVTVSLLGDTVTGNTNYGARKKSLPQLVGRYARPVSWRKELFQ